jgi:hypothetical protein
MQTPIETRLLQIKKAFQCRSRCRIGPIAYFCANGRADQLSMSSNRNFTEVELNSSLAEIRTCRKVGRPKKNRSPDYPAFVINSNLQPTAKVFGDGHTACPDQSAVFAHKNSASTSKFKIRSHKEHRTQASSGTGNESFGVQTAKKVKCKHQSKRGYFISSSSGINVGCKRGRVDEFSDSVLHPNLKSGCLIGDKFSVQELAHLPIIACSTQNHSNAPKLHTKAHLSPTSPQLFSLVTPEKRIEWESRCSSSISKGSSSFATFMFPSPSKLVFSPNGKAVFSPSCENFPKNECKL